MGEVYKAEDIRLNRKVALKFILPEYTRDKDSINQFIHEAQTASALDHQNIATIYEIDKSDSGNLFISMAYYNGETLKTKISKGTLEISENIDIAIQIAEGLTKVHNKGIIHRDIKPANIIIDNDGIVKIIDFGLSRLSRNFGERQHKSMLGTIPYMAPEEIMTKIVDHRIDIWSLGIVIYELLTGNKPFDASYDHAIIYSILNEEPYALREFNSEIPRDLEKIVMKAIEKEKEKRFSNMINFLIELKKVRYKYDYIQSQDILDKYHTPINKENRSLAVLPLENLMNDEEKDYLVDGITDELITDLAKVLELNVISRTSTIRFKARQKSIPEIADELNADLIVVERMTATTSMAVVAARTWAPVG